MPATTIKQPAVRASLSAKISLRLKLTLWFLAIFTTINFGLLICAWLVHSENFQRSLNQQLENAAIGLAELFQGAGKEFFANGLRPFQPTDRQYTLLAVRDQTGKILSASYGIEPEALPSVPQGASGQVASFHDVSQEMAQQLFKNPITTRMVTYPFFIPQVGRCYLDLAKTTDSALTEGMFVRNVFVIGGIIALLASAIAAWLLAGQAVSPYGRLSTAIREINPGDPHIQLELKSIEVEHLQAELNKAMEQLQERYKVREQFVANIAHELQTPISVLLTESQTLDPQNASLAKWLAYRKSIIEEMRKLKELVQSFLTLAQADKNGKLIRAKDLFLFDLVSDCVAKMKLYANKKGVRLILHMLQPEELANKDLQLRGDYELLCSMLNNLMRNAIHYSPAQSCVQVEVSATGNLARITVHDQGPGIPTSHLERIFDPFFRIDRNPSFTETKAEGFGLGLAIAKNVAELHNGSITVRNSKKRGCSFSIQLPLKNSCISRTKNSSAFTDGIL